MKELLEKIPVLGPFGRKLGRTLRTFSRRLRNKLPEPYVFQRVDPKAAGGAAGNAGPDAVRVVNLLNYTKTSQSAYSGGVFPAGYHSIHLPELDLAGQREPKERLRLAPVDFAGKTVLDIGCNQGGMLFGLPREIRHGIGIDFDRRLVNAANKVRSHARITNLDFFVFNLEQEPLELIRDFLPVEKVDVVLLLSVCMWIENWRDVVRFAASISNAMLFEANGKAEQQEEQVVLLREVYRDVRLLQEHSPDDPLQKKRKLYWCS